MKSDDLISRSALKKDLLDRSFFPSIVKAAVEKAPAVDAVELPVRPGRVVWILNHRFPAEIEEICIREDGVFAVWVEYDRSPELTEVWDDGEFDIKEVGKTVFLTVEELEKAEAEG